TGDVMLRRLLVSSSHYILGPFGPDTDLRRYGERLYERGGKNAKRRAVVAVARKLAVLLHALDIEETPFIKRVSRKPIGTRAVPLKRQLAARVLLAWMYPIAAVQASSCVRSPADHRALGSEHV